MCTFPKKRSEKAVLSSMEKKGGKTTFYKELKIRNGAVCSPILNFGFKPGWNRANFPRNYTYNTWLTRGIHVYRKNIRSLYYDMVLVPVEVKSEDFLAADKNTAVFKKVFISKENWDKFVQPMIKRQEEREKAVKLCQAVIAKKKG